VVRGRPRVTSHTDTWALGISAAIFASQCVAIVIGTLNVPRVFYPTLFELLWLAHLGLGLLVIGSAVVIARHARPAA